MILFGYSKHPRVLMPSSEQQFKKLDEEHKMLKISGIKEERIRVRIDYATWEVLRDMQEDFLFTDDRDEALLLCADKKADKNEGYMLALNIPDDTLVHIAQEERIEHDGKEVTVYRIPALEIGKLDPSVRKEFLLLMGLREHQQEMRAAQNAEYHPLPESQKSFLAKLYGIFPR